MIWGSTSEFIFIQIAAGRAGLGVRDLLCDMIEDALRSLSGETAIFSSSAGSA